MTLPEVLVQTSFMADNSCSRLHVVLKRRIKLWANFLSSGKLPLGNNRQKLVILEALGTEESS